MTRSSSEAVSAVTVATCTAALATLPVWLIGALAFQMREDLAFSEPELGLSIAAFMVAAAAASIPAGLLVKRIGWERGTSCVCAVMGVAGLLLAVVPSWEVLLLVLCFAGIGNAIAQPSSNLALVAMVPGSRQGIAFGLKQASVPAGTLAAGLAVPVIAIPFGWRWAFLAVTALATGVALATWRAARARPLRRARTIERPTSIPAGRRVPLLMLAAAGGLGTAASNSLGAFLVVYAVDSGMSPRDAATLLIAGSIANLVVRVALGLLADRRGGEQTALVSGMLVAGSAGFLAMGLSRGGPLFVLAALVVFVAGWGWNGLFHMSLMQIYRQNAAAATGVVSTFLYVGGAVGPLGFGLLATTSYAYAWFAAAGAALLAALTVAVASRALARGPLGAAHA